MESSIDFAFEGVEDIQEDQLQWVKDAVSDKYHNKMSNVNDIFWTLNNLYFMLAEIR